MKFFLFNGDSMIYLPKDKVVKEKIIVKESVEEQDNIILPSEIVHEFIDKANYLWIMNHCICREGENCQDYPHDLGCLFMGEAVLKINPKLGRLVNQEEAHAHIKRAQQEGLVHLIGRNKLDTIWMGVGPGSKLLTVCNCCPCCCLFKILPDLHPEISSSIQAMPGVEVFVDQEACIGCGRCAQEEICFMEAISMNGNHAVINENCRGCGRCVEICKQSAIQIRINQKNYYDNSIKLIEQEVDVT